MIRYHAASVTLQYVTVIVREGGRKGRESSVIKMLLQLNSLVTHEEKSKDLHMWNHATGLSDVISEEARELWKRTAIEMLPHLKSQEKAVAR